MAVSLPDLKAGSGSTVRFNAVAAMLLQPFPVTQMPNHTTAERGPISAKSEITLKMIEAAAAVVAERFDLDAGGSSATSAARLILEAAYGARRASEL